MSDAPPPGWNRTIDDLAAEIERGERTEIPDEEWDRACEYERSLLPADTVFPAEGEVWEALDDTRVRVRHRYSEPFTNDGEATFPRGERVRVGRTYEAQPIVITFEPVRYEELLEALVAAEVRAVPSFTRYSLSVKTGYFNQHFRRVADTAGG
jgi:hypothetical protein